MVDITANIEAKNVSQALLVTLKTPSDEQKTEGPQKSAIHTESCGTTHANKRKGSRLDGGRKNVCLNNLLWKEEGKHVNKQYF